MDTFHESPIATIIVEKQKYRFPKELLCNGSTFFNSAFNGGFREAQDLELKLEETTAKTFDLVIQWIYTGKFILPVTSTSASETFDQLLGFVKLADRLNLLGPLDTVVASMKALLVSDRDLLKPVHIRAAAELPREHVVRLLFADACAREYTLFVRSASKGFKFSAELKEIESFAFDLLGSFGLSVSRTRHTRSSIDFFDPLTKAYFNA